MGHPEGWRIRGSRAGSLPRPDFKGKLTPDEIIQFLRARVARYAVPKVVRIIDEMPQTEVHKVNKKALRESAAKETAGPAK